MEIKVVNLILIIFLLTIASVNLIKINVSNSMENTELIETTQTNNNCQGTVSTWSAGEAYAVGSIVFWQGSRYKCIQAHTSLGNWMPDAVPALWGKVNCDQPFEQGSTNCTGNILAWSGGEAYKLGAVVFWKGSRYKCIRAHKSYNSWMPDVTPGVWENLNCGQQNGSYQVLPNLSCTGNVANWTAMVYYSAGNVVAYNGNRYKCIRGHTSYSNWTPDVAESMWGKVNCEQQNASTNSSCDGTVPTWSAGEAYVVGKVVFWQGSRYKCIQAHTSLGNWMPDVVPALWGKVNCEQQNGNNHVIKDPSCLGNVLMWMPGYNYKAGYVVYYGNYRYKCIKDHYSYNNWTPNTAETLWGRVNCD